MIFSLMIFDINTRENKKGSKAPFPLEADNSITILSLLMHNKHVLSIITSDNFTDNWSTIRLTIQHLVAEFLSNHASYLTTCKEAHSSATLMCLFLTRYYVNCCTITSCLHFLKGNGLYEVTIIRCRRLKVVKLYHCTL